MKLQVKYLEKLQLEKTFIDIYTDHFEESRYGFIVSFNENLLLLEQFSDIGEADGISIIKIENITRIKWEGNDINTTAKFAVKEKRLENLENLKIDTIQNALKSIQNRFGYVNLYIQNIDAGMSIIGEVEELDDEIIIIKEFGTYTALDRKKLMLSVEEITKIDAGGKYENNLKELYL